MHRREEFFHMRMDADDRAALDKVSNRLKCSRAEAVRRLISIAEGHMFAQAPMCADGNRCFVPQMHTRGGAGV